MKIALGAVLGFALGYAASTYRKKRKHFEAAKEESDEEEEGEEEEEDEEDVGQGEIDTKRHYKMVNFFLFFFFLFPSQKKRKYSAPAIYRSTRLANGQRKNCCSSWTRLFGSLQASIATSR
jgi:hypothetical protein